MPATWVATRDVELSALTRFPGNARRGDVAAIRASIKRHGQYRSLVVRDTGDSLVILAGNHTRDAIEAEGHETARCEVIQCSDDEARRINLGDNRLAEIGDGYDNEALAELLAALDGDYDGTGWDVYDVDDLADSLGRDEPAGSGGSPEPEARPSLADRFLIPPFDVLDARQGWWQARKKAWIGLGIKSEIGRSGRLLDYSDQARSHYQADSYPRIHGGG